MTTLQPRPPGARWREYIDPLADQWRSQGLAVEVTGSPAGSDTAIPYIVKARDPSIRLTFTCAAWRAPHGRSPGLELWSVTVSAWLSGERAPGPEPVHLSGVAAALDHDTAWQQVLDWMDGRGSLHADLEEATSALLAASEVRQPEQPDQQPERPDHEPADRRLAITPAGRAERADTATRGSWTRAAALLLLLPAAGVVYLLAADRNPAVEPAPIVPSEAPAPGVTVPTSETPTGTAPPIASPAVPGLPAGTPAEPANPVIPEAALPSAPEPAPPEAPPVSDEAAAPGDLADGVEIAGPSMLDEEGTLADGYAGDASADEAPADADAATGGSADRLLPEPPAAPAAPAEPTPAEPPPRAAGPYLVHLASFRDPALVPVEWERLKARFPNRLRDLELEPPQPVSIPGRGTYYRVSAGSFATRAAAQAACDEVRAGGGSCWVSSR